MSSDWNPRSKRSRRKRKSNKVSTKKSPDLKNIFKGLKEKRREKENQENEFVDWSFSYDYLLPPVTDDDLESVLGKQNLEFKVIDGKKAPVSRSFVDAAIVESQFSRTDNSALTFNTSGDATVDFFFHVMEDTSKKLTVDLVKKSWAQNPLDTLKLIANLRDIRGGKAIKSQWLNCLYWIYLKHPRTLYNNLENFVFLGYWKDLLNLLIVILFKGHVGDYLHFDDAPDERHTSQYLDQRLVQSFQRGYAYNDLIATSYGQKRASLTRKQMKELRFRFARERIQKDMKYRVFHLKIAQLFAVRLEEDRKLLMEGGEQLRKISLAGKWSPSLKHHADRYSLISTSIALELVKLRKDESVCQEILSKFPPVAACLSRKILNKEYNIPLRAAQCVPEINMHPDKWALIDYKRVSSKCMLKNKRLFFNHDEDRFIEFVNNKKSKIHGATLKPVELVGQAINREQSMNETEKEIIIKQWQSINQDIKKKEEELGTSALSVCDVSYSMDGIAMEAAIGLTIRATQLSCRPWNEICVTFSDIPKFHSINPKHDVVDKINDMKRTSGYQKDLNAVFRLILDLAEKYCLKPEDLPKVLFIFSDMEFSNPYKTTYDSDGRVVKRTGPEQTNFQAAKESFEKKGFVLPTIVFWNLQSNGKKSTPIQKHESGGLLLSGYSGQMLTDLMMCKDLEKFTPQSLIKEILGKKRYDRFQLYD